METYKEHIKSSLLKKKVIEKIKLQNPGKQFKDQSYSLWQNMLNACASYCWNKTCYMHVHLIVGTKHATCMCILLLEQNMLHAFRRFSSNLFNA